MELKKVVHLAARRFFTSEYGIEFLLYLREQSPSIQKGLPHEIQFDAGYSQGYIKALERIAEAINPDSGKEIKIENE